MPKVLTWWKNLDSGPHPRLEDYRRELMDRVFRPFMVIGLLALGLGSWRAIRDGQWGFAAIYLGIYTAGIIVAITARHMGLRTRTQVMLTAILAIAAAALLRLGLGGVGVLLLFVWCGLTAILRGARAALGAVALGIALLGATGYAMVHGQLTIAPERALTSLSPSAWLVTAATFGAITAGLIIPVQALGQRFSVLMRNLELETMRTARSNEQLRQEAERREHAEEALRSSELRYRRIFESASVGIMEEDLSAVRAALQGLRAQGVDDLPAYFDQHPEFIERASRMVKILDVNQAAFETYGARSKEELLQSLDQILVADSVSAFRDVLVALAEGRPRFRGESVNRSLTGATVHVLLQASIPKDPEASVLVSVLDITARKMLEQSLADAQKMEAIGTLAGGIAHDFNNLLMGIRGYATLLREHRGERSAERSFVAGIDELVDSGAALTGQLLGFARGGKYDSQTTDLRRLLDSSLSMFSRAKKELDVHRALAPELWTIDGDRTQLEQVMLNLYVNAWQAMPEGGRLDVAATNIAFDEEAAGVRGLPPGDYVHITVRDTGTGMDAATCARVFEPFFTTKELGHGTGLGLASTYAIARNHGGTIEVQSEPGAGATFHLYLPASKKPAVSRESILPKAEQGTETVLLVDDEPALLRSTAMMLELLGYRVLTAPDGQAALNQFDSAQEAVSVVILDMIMPGMNGAETFEQLRARSSELRILLSSGYSQDARAEALLKLSPAAFLQKPFRLETLSQKLRQLLDS